MTSLARAALVASCAALVISPRAAHAQQAVAIDMSGTLDSRYGGLGVGIEERFGYRTALPRGLLIHGIILQPELVFGYVQMPWATAENGLAQMAHAGAGGRLGFLLDWFEPFAYGHVSAVFGVEGFGPQYDFGVALDGRLSGSSLGLHGSYVVASLPGGTRQWWAFGPHVELRFFVP